MRQTPSERFGRDIFHHVVWHAELHQASQMLVWRTNFRNDIVYLFAQCIHPNACISLLIKGVLFQKSGAL